MRIETHSHQGLLKMPTTSVHQLLDDQLTIFLRSWGSQDYDQKFIEEVSHFLSTAQADIEVTSPFDFAENLTQLANKVRVAILLAHDYFYKIENKNFFSVGFECLILMRSKNELAWGAVGRFDLYELEGQATGILTAVGTDRDRQTLLPIELLGVEREIELRCGSTRFSENTFVASSVYQNQIQFNLVAGSDQWSIGHQSVNGSYWYSKIKSE